MSVYVSAHGKPVRKRNFELLSWGLPLCPGLTRCSQAQVVEHKQGQDIQHPSAQARLHENTYKQSKKTFNPNSFRQKLYIVVNSLQNLQLSLRDHQ